MRKAVLGVLLLSVGIAGGAAADPIALTSGGMFVYPDGSLVTFEGAADGFSASGSGSGTGFLTGFHAGDVVNLSTHIHFTGLGAEPAALTSGGVTQSGYLSAVFDLDARPFVAEVVSPSQTFRTPFTMTGVLQLFAHPADGVPLITQDVTAQGFASFGARDIGLGQYLADGGLALTFAPASTPPATPEPASLLLLGTGVAAVWRSKRPRRG